MAGEDADGDIVDAMDAVDLVDAVKSGVRQKHSCDGHVTDDREGDESRTASTITNAANDNDSNEKYEFVDFKQNASSLAGVTVAEAQELAAEAAAAIEAHAVVYENCGEGFANVASYNNQSNDIASGESTTKIAEPQTSTKDRSRFVTPKDFELLKVIGMGAFGKVLQVKNKQSSQILAMKVISKRLLRRKTGYIENVQAERNILKRINHPFVVKMHCSFQTREKLFIVMDFLAGGELFLRLGREGIFLEKDAAFYLAEIILGLDHLHQTGILHRDLKPENILLSADNHVVLTDFGLAKDFGPEWGRSGQDDGEQERALTICGTAEYMSPEMVANKGYGKASDYWSLGCIAYEMLNGLPPFSSKQGTKELFRKIMSEKIKMPPGSTAAACKLLKGLLNRNPDQRLGATKSTMFEVGGVTQLKRSAFFDKIDFDKLERKDIAPPYAAKVECEEKDLRHFHDDFIKMDLPRSVKEMSKEGHVARRVDSTTFRGFSFIQDDYLLPQRNPKEIEMYWTSQPDEDGESNSEMASSKADLEDSPAELELLEKKKRPPRKRKKKKNDETVPEVASAASSIADKSPVPSVIEDAITKGESSSTDQPENESTALPSNRVPLNLAVATNNPVRLGTAPAAVAMLNSPTTSPPSSHVTKSVENTWQSAGNSTKNKPQTYQPPHLRNPQAVPTPSSGARIGWNKVQYPTPSRTAPAPDSWAARIHSSTPTSLPSPSSLSYTSTVPSPAIKASTGASPWNKNRPNPDLPPPVRVGQEPPPSPSSDWRDHASPQVRKVIHRSSLQSPPASLTTGGGGAWPSLKYIPAAPSLPPPGHPAAANLPSLKATPPNALQGAWASRSKP